MRTENPFDKIDFNIIKSLRTRETKEQYNNILQIEGIPKVS